MTPIENLYMHLQDDIQAVNAQIKDRMESHIPLIPKIADHLISAGGKRIRPLMTLGCTAIYDGDMARAHPLAAAIEFIHSATLLHDDVVDESPQRRGKQSAAFAFGNQFSVLVGDFLFARAFEMMTQDDEMQVMRIISTASATIAEGEVIQLENQGNMDLSEETYIKMISAKTAALFAAACQIGPVIAKAGDPANQNAYDYGLNLGIAFQIADDALDYAAKEDDLGKKVGDDFREGKLTAPVLIALKDASDDERKFWKRTLSMRDQKDGDLQQALDILQRHDAITKSLDMARSYGAKAKQALAETSAHPISKILVDLIDYTIERKF